ncbi:MAG: META domain-containing protein [Nocardioidaceae bacterium]
MAGLTVVTTLCGCANEVATREPAAPQSPSTQTVSPSANGPVAARDLVGEWRPTSLLGRDVTSLRTVDGQRPEFFFHLRGRLAGGSNGCNIDSFHYRVSRAGRFRAELFATTTRRCERRADENRLPNVAVMTRARSVRLVNGRLTLFGEHGELLGVYQRAERQPGWVAVEQSGSGG